MKSTSIKLKIIGMSIIGLNFLAGCTIDNKKFDWQTRSPRESNLKAELLESLVEKIKDSTFHSVDAILLVKDKSIVLEKYFNGFTKDSLHNTASVGKSIISALIGISIENGLIPGLEASIVSYFSDTYQIKNFDDGKRSITVKDLLTMSSGLDCNDWDENSPGNTKNFVEAKDDFALTLNLPMIRKNGEKFAYCSGGANLLGEIIRRQSGKSLQKYADSVLFRKIGVRENKWFIVPKPPYYEFAGGGNFLKPRDMARFGLLYANKGKWNGKQIISEKWIEESTSKQIEVPDENGDYGYFWWIKEYQYNGKKTLGFEASGNGGNKITVAPELDLVFVLTGSGYGSEYVEGEQARIIFENYILRAFK